MKNTDVDKELQAFIDADDGAVPSAEEEKAALLANKDVNQALQGVSTRAVLTLIVVAINLLILILS
ncbi:MAG: hypothetical protein JKY56_21320 [Kofleriaceae bacterium]|nr:hypothetical protein [Kofleriaceae bacterium]